MLCAGNRTVGSNPTLSAIRYKEIRRQFSIRSNTAKVRSLAIAVAGLVVAATSTVVTGMLAQRRATTHAAVCGNPKITCKTSATFKPNDLPFQVPRNSVIVDTAPFYAIILQSMTVRDDDCKIFIPERERLAAQGVFPDHKVFSSRCTDPENSFYADVSSRNTRYFSETHRILAVYAGTTMTQAKTMLAAVQATGKYPGANIRRMRTGFNGT